uniref:Putative secreted peptide n=1 Tax=Anopheles braziliensis TaxID=58242 RepID=A0A2M3ZRJ3_9DIPT
MSLFFGFRRIGFFFGLIVPPSAPGAPPPPPSSSPSTTSTTSSSLPSFVRIARFRTKNPPMPSFCRFRCRFLRSTTTPLSLVKRANPSGGVGSFHTIPSL